MEGPALTALPDTARGAKVSLDLSTSTTGSSSTTAISTRSLALSSTFDDALASSQCSASFSASNSADLGGTPSSQNLCFTPQDLGGTPFSGIMRSSSSVKSSELVGSGGTPPHFTLAALQGTEAELSGSTIGTSRTYGDGGTQWSFQSAGLQYFPLLVPSALGKIHQISNELRLAPLDFFHRRLPDKLLKNVRSIDVDDDPFEHLRRARLTVHPLLRCWDAEASALFAIQKLATLRADVVSWRAQILEEIKLMKDDMVDEIAAWEASLPDFVKLAYKESGLCVPLFIKLLRMCDYPDADQLEKDLSGGFWMVGEIPSGVGWPSSSDPGPSLSWEEFAKLNDEYIGARLSKHLLPDFKGKADNDVHELLLSEILDERDKGRMTGPYAAPAKWLAAASPPQGTEEELLPPPADDECYPAMAFPILQYGSDGMMKTRRGEDWRRSHSNRLATTRRKPVHHTTDYYMQAGRLLKSFGLPRGLLWGHDHEGAYRQFPAGPRQLLWSILEGPQGFTLWQHCVMVFGAKAAVWAYNRVGDAITFLARVLLLMLVFHFVDDYGGIEPEPSAYSAFDSFAKLGELIGFKTKKSKEHPPASTHIFQGVQLTVDENDFVTEITSARRKRMLAEIDKLCAAGIITPKQAQVLAGKAVFTNASIFGALGAAALRPLFRRAAFGGTKIDTDLEASLHILRHLLVHAPPRTVSLDPVFTESPILYADAFFEIGGKKRSLRDMGEVDIGALRADSCNGWGVVVIHGRRAWHFSGSVPSRVLGKLEKKKTYIFLLEVVAQCFGVWFLGKELAPHCWAFVDNVGAEHALRKGASRNRDANAFISLFWITAAALRVTPWFERVPSKAQFADGVSRGDDTDALSIGSVRLDFNYNGIWDIILDVVNSGGLASDTHCRQLLAVVGSERERLSIDPLDFNGEVLSSGSEVPMADRLLTAC